MEANGAPFTLLPLSVLRLTGIQSYGYTDQRKVEADVEVTEDRTEDLSLRKQLTSRPTEPRLLLKICLKISCFLFSVVSILIRSFPRNLFSNFCKINYVSGLFFTGDSRIPLVDLLSPSDNVSS